MEGKDYKGIELQVFKKWFPTGDFTEAMILNAISDGIEAGKTEGKNPVKKLSDADLEALATKYADEEMDCWSADYNGYLRGAKDMRDKL